MVNEYLQHANNHDLFSQDFRQENSREAEKSIDKANLHKLILKAMQELKVRSTFHDIARHLKLKSEQIHKRMSELEKQGKVVTCGKKKDSVTNVNCTAWMLKPTE